MIDIEKGATGAARTETKSSKDYSREFTYILIGVFILLAALNLLYRFFDHDELEHIHSAWYVAGGYHPYRDFFQVHHPLLWVVLAPWIWLFGAAVPTMFWLRGLMMAFTLGSIVMVCRIAREMSRSGEVGRMAALLLASTVMFWEKGIEVRPDVPMVFFALSSILWLFRFFYYKRDKYLLYSGLLASLSFLFLQKSVFLLAGCGIIFIFYLVKREMTIKQVLVFACGVLLPLSGLLGYLLATGSFHEYTITNWLLHPHIKATFSPHHTLLGLFAENTFSWLIFLVAVVWVAFKGSDRRLKTVTVLAAVHFLGIFFIPRPFKQNFMLLVALLSIPAAYLIKFICVRYKWGDLQKIRLFSVIVIVPLLVLTVMVFLSHRPQLQRIRYVLENSDKTDLVYDGDIKFNLFRRDIHYFWYGLRRGKEFDAYNDVTGGMPADYDVCRLIRQKQPRFISDFFLNLSRCRLNSNYRFTGYKSLYFRVDLP